MTARFAFSNHVGTVDSFDVQGGAGTVTDGERQWPFHCTQIGGGARAVAAGTSVLFDVVAGLPGRWEAVRLSARPGSFLCPVCAASVTGEVGQYEICPMCGWEDDPVQRDDHQDSGANSTTLNEARNAMIRTLIESATGIAAPDARG
jgi:cold shock CspA family protein